MPFTLTSVIIDAADIETEGAFWHRLLGGSTTTTPTHHFIQAPDLPVIVIQSAPDHTAPDWPNGTPQEMHLDFAVEDLATADRAATDAGATRLRPTEAPASDTGSSVYASPAGHPFCLRAA
ncbi:VOC family protein [Streptomyces sp. R527F]|uniref:VOC family protein n=1 Tax=Streptomyces sp. R527F TaxID=1664033 RepID=UPI001F3C7925|nr:VOC family protein [Streptomyces sp. R527F]UIZ17233.1 VOC family protein [Streptomyces sp. R527F]